MYLVCLKSCLRNLSGQLASLRIQVPIVDILNCLGLFFGERKEKRRGEGWWEYYLSPRIEKTKRIMPSRWRVLALILTWRWDAYEPLTWRWFAYYRSPSPQFDARTGDENGGEELVWFFHGICSVFCNFWKFDGFSALLVFAGGGRACKKIQFWEINFGDESITSHQPFFSSHER